MTEPTPYLPRGARRRRSVLIVLAVVAVAAAGLTLHLLGILPPG